MPKTRAVLAGRLEMGIGALGRAHTLGDGVLSGACARARVEHLTGHLALQCQCVVGFVKVLADTSVRKERVVVMGNGFVI